MCTLDVSKAFDKVNQCKLFIKLMKRNLPVNIILLLNNWLSKVFISVRWSGVDSEVFQLFAGVRQGGVLSPCLFAIYVNDVLEKICKSHFGCHIENLATNIFMYADDIILLSSSLTDLQRLIDICEYDFYELDLKFNIKKSACLRIGKAFSAACANIVLNNEAIPWVFSTRYLGVYFKNGTKCNFDFTEIKSKFYRSVNSIFSKIGTMKNINVVLSLLFSFSVPIIMYALEAIQLNNKSFKSLENSYFKIFYKVFNTFDKNIINHCMYYFGYKPFCYEYDYHKILFLKKMSCNQNMMLSLLFEKFAKSELVALCSKYDISNRPNDVKRKIWNFFEEKIGL